MGLALDWVVVLFVCDAGTLDISWLELFLQYCFLLCLFSLGRKCTWSPDIVHVGYALKSMAHWKRKKWPLGYNQT